MNNYSYRDIQNLPRIGPVFSTQDEKQRLIADGIIEGKIKPELKLKINMNIRGLEKKKFISPKNPETFRLAARMSAFGKDGWCYFMTSSNVARFGMPLMVFGFYYYVGMTPIMQNYQEKELLNWEFLTINPKFQIVAPHYHDKVCYMA